MPEGRKILTVWIEDKSAFAGKLVEVVREVLTERHDSIVTVDETKEDEGTEKAKKAFVIELSSLVAEVMKQRLRETVERNPGTPGLRIFTFDVQPS